MGKASVLLATAAFTAGCVANPPYLWWTVVGVAGDFSDAVGDYCTLTSHVFLQHPIPAEWAGSADLLFIRTFYRNGVHQEAGEVRGEASVRIVRRGDTVAVSYDSPFAATLIGTTSGEAFEGAWPCDSSFPLADDSTRSSPGSWSLVPVLNYQR
jgi:hypothetical protein